MASVPYDPSERYFLQGQKHAISNIIRGINSLLIIKHWTTYIYFNSYKWFFSLQMKHNSYKLEDFLEEPTWFPVSPWSQVPIPSSGISIPPLNVKFFILTIAILSESYKSILYKICFTEKDNKYMLIITSMKYFTLLDYLQRHWTVNRTTITYVPFEFCKTLFLNQIFRLDW